MGPVHHYESGEIHLIHRLILKVKPFKDIQDD